MNAKRNWMAGVGAALVIAGSAMPTTAQAALVDRGGGMIYDTVLDITWLGDANYAKTELSDLRVAEIIAAVGSSFNWQYGTGREEPLTAGGFSKDDNGDYTGRMNFPAALAWVDQLSYGGYNDWRLPTMVDTGDVGCVALAFSGTDCGWNVQTVEGSTVYSELGHMFYNNLGFKGYYSPSGPVQADWGIFGNGSQGGERDDLGPNGAIDNLQSWVYWFGMAYPEPAPKGLVWAFNMDNGGQSYGGYNAPFNVWAVHDGDVANVGNNVPEPGTLFLSVLALAGVGLARHRRLP